MIDPSERQVARHDDEAAGRVFGARFRATSLQKNRGGTETWRGTDLSNGSDVMIKIAATRAAHASVGLRFEHEAHVLREAQSRWLVPLLAFGREREDESGDDELLYMVMPLVEGTTLEERIAKGPLSVRDVVVIGRCVPSALEEIHRHGMLHRDVKASNVIVDNASPISRATLLDVGLARSEKLDVAIRDLPAGTARYMSPEQSGFLEREVAAASDLYSVGILLYESLAGAPPFAGESVGDVLRQHLTTVPAELRSRGVHVPRVLDEVIQRLLQKDPRDRYQSAAAVRADLDAIFDKLDDGIAEPEIVIGSFDQRSTLAEPGFIGRTRELASLESEFACAKGGDGVLVFVEAESGGGKSRLLDEWAQRCRQEGAIVVRGQGVAMTAARPFQMLAGIADGILAAAALDPGFVARVRDALGDRIDAVLDALPELTPLLLPARLQSRGETLGPELHGELRSLDALAELLDALGTPATPAAILLDDCQWSDELTVKLLAHWQKRYERARELDTRVRRHVVIALAFRSEEVAPSHSLRSLSPNTELVLSPLANRDVKSLVESMAGPLPDAATAIVTHLAEGNPFMASAVIRGLVELGSIVRTPSGWTIDPIAIAAVQSSREAAIFLSKSLDRLDENTKRLLAIGAVLGKEFDLDLAGALADQTNAQVIAAHDDARKRHIIWDRANGGRSVFVHDKLRETLLGKLGAEERKGLHLRAAAHLEKNAKDRVFDLAYHFDAAGDPDRALPYARDAAERSRAQHALEVAEKHYRMAVRAPSADAETRRTLREGLGDVLMLRGLYSQAATELEAARDLASTNLDRATIEGKLGELAFKRGDVKLASVFVERALALLGRTVPQRLPLLLAMVIWEVAVQLLHTLFPRVFLARRARPAPGSNEIVALRMYSRLAYIYWFARGQVPCLWAHLREMNLAERFAPSAELAQAYSEHAPVMSTLSLFDRGITYAKRSLQIRKDLNDVWGQGQSLHFYGIVLYAAGRFEECAEKCREAVRLLSRTGDRWEVNTAEWHIAFCLYRLGELRAAVEASKRVYRAGIEIGDMQAVAISLSCWSKASEGRVDEALFESALDGNADDIHSMSEVLQGEGVRLMGLGELARATAVLERADRKVKKAGLKSEYVAPVVLHLLTSIRMRAEEVSPLDPRTKGTLIARARAVARRARRIAKAFPNNAPHALRESGLVEALAGRASHARAYLDESLRIAERMKMRHERALTLIARGRIGIAHQWHDAAEDARAGARLREELLGADAAIESLATPLMRRVAPSMSLSLADRFPRVLDAGRKIASALTKEAIFAAVRESALALLRGERCVVSGVSGDADHSARWVPVDGGVSATAVERAFASGRPAVFTSDVAESDSESLVLSGVRSALCAPIFKRKKTAAFFYVTHERVGGLFGETEERLAEFIATIAGAALENAEGFENSEALSIEREQLYQKAQAAVGVRDEFLSIASHELKTPLTTLLLQVESFLRRANATDEATIPKTEVKRLERVASHARRIGKLIDDLLDVSRITQGRLALDLEEVDLAAIVVDVVERLRVHGRTIRVDVASVVTGQWDKMRLEQIVTNLLTNAIKFGGEAPIDVVLTEKDGVAKLVVRDHGIGIAADAQKRIFERFERAVSSRHYGGLGLGLWIVRQIVEALRGEIRVWSAEGQGSRFEVDLPCVREAPPASDSERDVASAS